MLNRGPLKYVLTNKNFYFFPNSASFFSQNSIFQFSFIRILVFFLTRSCAAFLVFHTGTRVHISTCYYVDRFWNTAYHPTHGSRSEIARLQNSASFIILFCFFLPILLLRRPFQHVGIVYGGAADMQVVPQEKNVPLSQFQSKNGLILYHSRFNHRNHRARPLNWSFSLNVKNRGAQKQRDDGPGRSRSIISCQYR